MSEHREALPPPYRSSSGLVGLMFKPIISNPLDKCVTCHKRRKVHETNWCPRCMPKHIFKAIVRAGRRAR